jgi:hypothetical protein
MYGLQIIHSGSDGVTCVHTMYTVGNGKRLGINDIMIHGIGANAVILGCFLEKINNF